MQTLLPKCPFAKPEDANATRARASPPRKHKPPPGQMWVFPTCCPMAPLALRAASSGGSARGLAPGMGSEITMPGWWAPGGMTAAAPLICWARNMARSGSLLGSAQACCHTGIFWDKSSFPCGEEQNKSSILFLYCAVKPENPDVFESVGGSTRLMKTLRDHETRHRSSGRCFKTGKKRRGLRGATIWNHPRQRFLSALSRRAVT